MKTITCDNCDAWVAQDADYETRIGWYHLQNFQTGETFDACGAKCAKDVVARDTKLMLKIAREVEAEQAS